MLYNYLKLNSLNLGIWEIILAQSSNSLRKTIKIAIKNAISISAVIITNKTTDKKTTKKEEKLETEKKRIIYK